MTFPTVRSFATNTTSGTSHVATMPGTIVAGDLLVLFCSSNNSVNPGTPAGWTELSHSALARMGVFVKVAAGGDAATTTTAATSGVNHVSMAIQDWGGTLTDVEAVPLAGGVDPPTITASWGVVDNLFLELLGGRGGTVPSVSAWSTGYNEIAKLTTDLTTDVFAGVASRELAAATDDPDSITVTGSMGDPVSYMLVVKPTPPPGATDLTVTPISSTTNRLDWVDPTPEPDGVKIERSPTGAGSWTQIGSEPPGVQSFQDTTGDPFTEYFYRVIAFDGSLDSAASNVASGTTYDTATISVVVGVCWGGAADVTITVIPGDGAIVEVEDEAEEVYEGDSIVLNLPAGTYEWEIEALAGFEIVGATSGTFLVCPIARTVSRVLSTASLET